VIVKTVNRVVHATWMGGGKCIQNLAKIREGGDNERLRHTWEDDIKTDVKE
jgi:hypothetical protein